jgi:hypothetical protein
VAAPDAVAISEREAAPDAVAADLFQARRGGHRSSAPGRDARMSVLAKRLVPGVVEPTMDRAIARVRR